MDGGWTAYYQRWEKAEYAKACAEDRQKAGLIVSDDTVMNCIDCELQGTCETRGI